MVYILVAISMFCSGCRFHRGGISATDLSDGSTVPEAGHLDGGVDPDASDGSVNPRCGDGVVDPEEECDDGEVNSDLTPNACRTDCRAAHCGDGVVDQGEECDDNNVTDGDGCSSTCVTFPVPVDEVGWTCFEEDLTSCTGLSCRTDDSIETCNPDETGDCVTPPCVYIYTGWNGYCGYGGTRKEVFVPNASQVYLSFQSKASCDTYGYKAGVVLNDGTDREWMRLYDREESNWNETLFDVAPWAGQTVTIEVVVQDTSTDWCNAGDRTYRIWADEFRFTQ